MSTVYGGPHYDRMMKKTLLLLCLLFITSIIADATEDVKTDVQTESPTLNTQPLLPPDFKTRRQEAREKLRLSDDYRFGNDSASITRDIHRAIELLEEIIAIEEPKGFNKVKRDAAYCLGEIYESGEGLDMNLTRAMELYNMSASLGSPEGQQSLAFYWATGRAGSKNIPLSLIYHAFAAQGADRAAQLTLGYKYLFGHHVTKSCEKAVERYEDVAAQVVEEVKELHLGGLTYTPDIQKISEVTEASQDKLYKEESEIVKYYQYHAGAGDVNAQTTMGTLHMKGGYNLDQDYAKAFEWYERAAEQGDGAGMGHLGFMYAHGYHVEKNVEKAIELYQKAADKGNPLGQTNLGYMYMTGNGVTRNLQKAHHYFKLAADQQYSEGLLNLGILYYNGEGVKQDNIQALKYFSMASAQGNLPAMYYLGQMHQFGLGTSPSCQTAVMLYKQVAEKGPWFSELEAAMDLYLDGNVDAALNLYERAAEQGHEIAQTNAAYLYDKECSRLLYNNRTSPSCHEMAFEYYRNSAEQQNAKSMLRMGDFHFYGVGCAEELDRAALYYQASSELRDAQAMFNLGYMHQHGLGLPKDLHLAKRHYDKALEIEANSFLAVYGALFTLLFQFVFEGNFQLGWSLPSIGVGWDVMAIALLSFIGLVLLYIRNNIYV
ncbi:hypothetical protein PROFUN_02695 [Planoprotostelium fungivorum]|uniref:Uncharacterized protein n=1 Tax=Planoprotostelium fungivorum TaxID=1890364 RepID=A0A2P6NVR6_9EUKA|nr:hypothetical protein PROFUN_02695 [Planoprotostelium fungivorum]